MQKLEKLQNEAFKILKKAVEDKALSRAPVYQWPSGMDGKRFKITM